MRKKKQKLFSALVLLLFPVLLHTQVISYVDTTFSIFVPKALFGEINLNTCKDSLVETELGYELCYDMMVQSNGDIYGVGLENAGFPFNDTVFFLSLDAPSTTYANPQGNNIMHEIRGLTCDENGVAYAAGRGISKRDPGCCATNINSGGCCTKWEETYLGTLPPNMQCLGDLTYRKGKFYLSAIGNKLVEVNMKNVAKSKIIYEFPPGTMPIQGLTTVQFSCDSVKTYAIGRAWDHSIVYELDFDNWTLKQVCDMQKLAVDGAGNITECALPPCNLFVDLDSDNSSLGFLGNRCADIFCTTPVFVADTDVVVRSLPGFIDSITLQLTGTFDGALEYLSVSSPVPNIAVTGNGTASLALVNNGAIIEDFEEAIKAIAYLNNASIPTLGMRRVLVLGWAGGEASPLSVAELPLAASPCDTLIDEANEAVHQPIVDLKLSPNPATKYTDADISISDYNRSEPLTLALTDGLGQNVWRKQVSANAPLQRIETSDLAAGLYFVYLSSASRVLVGRKLVVLRD